VVFTYMDDLEQAIRRLRGRLRRQPDAPASAE
jgi:hypothetical protein